MAVAGWAAGGSGTWARADEARVQKGVSYGAPGNDDERQRLDIHAPAEGTNLPIMIWIHGGGWQFGSKFNVGAKPKAFNEKGFVLVSMNYRLYPATDYKGQGADIAKAIRWVREHAGEFGASPDRIFLMGHSAGAHLAALVATDHRYLEAEGLKLDAIQGVVLLDGAAYDVARQIEQAGQRSRLFVTVFSEDPKAQADASPTSHVASNKGIPPFLILHVERRIDARLQSETLGAKLRDAGGEARVVACSGKTHATINSELGVPGDVPTGEVFEFLTKRLSALDESKSPIAPTK